MYKNLRWKLLTVVGVTALAVWSFYPPAQKVKLGLDLQGGVHLVLQVQTDDALRLQTQTAAERLREELKTQSLDVGDVAEIDATSFKVTGVPTDKDSEFRRIAQDQVGTDYDREPGVNGAYTFRMKPNIAVRTRQDTVTQALQTIERRVNELGVSEPLVAATGPNGDQIMVQLPGVTDVARAKEIIKSTAVLEWMAVDGGPAATREQLLQATGGTVPSSDEVVPGDDESGSGDSVYYLLKKVPVVSGTMLRNARPTLDEYNKPAVSFSLDAEGARRFSRFTGANIGKRVAIVLDNRVRSAPRIDSRIGGEGRITGAFSQQEVQDLSLILKSGALPASLTYLEERTVGPTLGADSVRAGVISSITGLLAVAVFMLFYYRLAGINAIVSVTLNLVILMGFMSYVGRGHDAAGHRRLHPDDRHGRRLERAHLRAHPRGAARGQGRPRGGGGRVRPRVPHHSRHARRVDDLGGLPVPVRHGPDPRLRHDAVLRVALEPVHVGVRVEDPLRDVPLSAVGDDVEHLTAGVAVARRRTF